MSAYSAKILKASDVTVSAVTPDFSENATMRFAALMGPDERELLLNVTGTLASKVMDGDYGQSFFFAPSSADLPLLEKLEDLEIEGLPEEYTQRRTLNSKRQLNVKVKIDEDDNLKFIAPFSREDLSKELSRNRSCKLSFTPGFYFADEKKQYGIYFSLKEVTFPDTKGSSEVSTTKVAKKSARATKSK